MLNPLQSHLLLFSMQPYNYLGDEKISVGSFINIIRADKNKIDEVFLGVVLNSIMGRLQGAKEKSGIAQPYIYAKNLREFKIPTPPREIQEQIAALVKRHFSLKQQRDHLLEVAKQAVEKALEADEATAFAWLEKVL